MKTDAEQIADYADNKLCLQHAQLGRAYYYQSLSLCVIDAVFSIGVRYGQVEKAICHFSKVTGWTIFRLHGSTFISMTAQKTIWDLLAEISKHTNPETTLFNNSGYANPASSKGRIRKAKLVQQFAQVLQSENIETFQDLGKHPDKTVLEKKLRALPASSSGVVVRYFQMLAGDDSEVKPDRMILRFIKDAIGKHVSADIAAKLIQDACAILQKAHPDLTPRLLDHEVWKYQRAK